MVQLLSTNLTKIGINNNAPTYTLDVTGQARLQNNSGPSFFWNNTS